MTKESTISKIKWIGVSAIISSIVSFIFIPFLDYFSDKVLKFDLSTISPYIIPIVLGFSGSVLLISYYILSINNRNDDDKWRFFPANSNNGFSTTDLNNEGFNRTENYDE